MLHRGWLYVSSPDISPTADLLAPGRGLVRVLATDKMPGAFWNANRLQGGSHGSDLFHA